MRRVGIFQWLSCILSVWRIRGSVWIRLLWHWIQLPEYKVLCRKNHLSLRKIILKKGLSVNPTPGSLDFIWSYLDLYYWIWIFLLLKKGSASLHVIWCCVFSEMKVSYPSTDFLYCTF